MSSRQPVGVTFLPSGLRVEANRGDTVLDAALENGLALEHECGGNCSCTTCRVEILAGAVSLSSMEWPENERLGELQDRTPASRLACQALITGCVDVMVRIPEHGASETPQ